MSAEFTWVKVEDTTPLRLRRAGKDAFCLWFTAVCHLSHYLQGDVLVDDDVPIVAAEAKVSQPERHLEALAEHGLAERTEEGWRMLQRPEIGDWARTEADVERMRAAKARAGQESQRKRREAKEQREEAERQHAVQQAVQQRAQRPVQHGVQQAVQQGAQHDAQHAPQQTRDGSLSSTTRETSPKRLAVPVEISAEAKAVAAAGVAAARSTLQVVPDIDERP